ncbi:phosphoribosyltransferase family protein [Haloferax larsenii]|uniref:Adenine phosphoribosyltransferase n=1 Tax=Haloferax larsenii TaxID=302484 RepID=A0A1H7T024_HALLR|nr:phosphoribosyltransferase family protein [Haloferax larsenii]SEL77895.1 adenine phosphoribosyltransferase [Haloferax larsenii]
MANQICTESDTEEAIEQIRDVYRNASVTQSQEYITTVNQLTDQLPALQPETLSAASTLVQRRISESTDVIAVEEDKGLPIGVLAATELQLPLAVARWYTYEIDVEDEPQVEVEMDSEYYSGQLYLNGVTSGDSVTIVDDTISTGGTMTALIDAIREAGASVEGAHCLVEKRDNGGVERVEAETGVSVSTEVVIRADHDGVEVIE